MSRITPALGSPRRRRRLRSRAHESEQVLSPAEPARSRRSRSADPRDPGHPLRGEGRNRSSDDHGLRGLARGRRRTVGGSGASREPPRVADPRPSARADLFAPPAMSSGPRPSPRRQATPMPDCRIARTSCTAATRRRAASTMRTRSGVAGSPGAATLRSGPGIETSAPLGGGCHRAFVRPPELKEAVASLLAQDVKPEIVVRQHGGRRCRALPWPLPRPCPPDRGSRTRSSSGPPATSAWMPAALPVRRLSSPPTVSRRPDGCSLARLWRSMRRAPQPSTAG